MSALVTKLYSIFRGTHVGTDEFGNTYYTSRQKISKGSLRTQKRWVIYKDDVEASKVPPVWHAWLHHTTDHIPSENHIVVWIKPHLENLSGTPYAYRPKGHTLIGRKRQKTTGDYQAWKPH